MVLWFCSWECSSKLKLSPDLWKEIPTFKQTVLPHDINGRAVYELPLDPDNRMASSRNERRWKRYITSACSSFKGIRRLARCVGSFKSTNSQCNYRKKWGPNVTHLNEDGQVRMPNLCLVQPVRLGKKICFF